MPTINRFADFHDEITAWRRDMHEHPELLYEVHRTAGLVEDKLKEFGVDEITTGIGRTGVVGVIKGRNSNSGKVIGLRADMDALPIHEMTKREYASKTDGIMHACGHDGHTAMLLGAAKYLAETRNFDGTAVIIFQPAEEGGAGGKAMVDDGLIENFKLDEVYGMHNMPGIPVGEFAIRKGAMMAATDTFEIEIEGKGAHAAMPHNGVDPIIVGASLVQALQSIASRTVDPLESVVVSVTTFHGGDAFNVIPQTIKLTGTVRTLSAEVRDTAERRMKEIVEHTAAMYGATAKLHYDRGYPTTDNHSKQTDFAVEVAREVVGHDRVNPDTPPLMGGEDFSFMLNACPGAYIFVGQGDTAGVHHPEYDFNDDIIPIGCSYWAKIVETAMPLEK
jgi:amidohydrolase